MSVVVYTAKRSLLPGHTVDVPYELGLRQISADHTRDVRKSEQRALSRLRETLFWNGASGLAITIGSYPEQSVQFDAVIEFLESVERGETFTYDRYGSAGAPASPRSAVLVGTYQVQRYARQAGEGNDLMRFSFTIEFT